MKKKVKLSVPIRALDEVLAFAWDNKFILIASYSVDEVFGDTKVILYYALDEDQLSVLAGSQQYSKYVTKK